MTSSTTSTDSSPSLSPSSSPYSYNPSESPHQWFHNLMTRRTTFNPLTTLQIPNPNLPNSPSQPAALVVAPMVDQSDLPFRKVCYLNGANLAYTPMIHGRMFLETKTYTEKFMPHPRPIIGEECGDGTDTAPLFAQFCGNDPDILLKAMSLVVGRCDAVDLNCGCPQGIAKRGRYGAFLLEEGDVLVSIVKHLAENLKCRVTVKVRILPTGLDDSIALYTRLIDAGASLLTVHGRTRHQKGQLTGECSWSSIATIIKTLGHRIPIMSNGGISNLDDAKECLKITGAMGIMSSEGILEYPALFTETNVMETDFKRTGPTRVKLARDYMAMAKLFPPDKGGQGNGCKCVKDHLQKMLYTELQENVALRDLICNHRTSTTMEHLSLIIDEVEKYQKIKEEYTEDSEALGWYVRHRMGEEDADDNGGDYTRKLDVKQLDLMDDEDWECGACMFGVEGGSEGAGDY